MTNSWTHLANVYLFFLQVKKNVAHCFNVLTTSAFVFKTGTSRGKTTGRSEDSQSYHKAREHYTSATKETGYKDILQRSLNDDWYRATLQHDGFSKAKVQERDHIAEGAKREHAATAAERRQWSNTWFLEQTAAGGPSTVAPRCAPR